MHLIHRKISSLSLHLRFSYFNKEFSFSSNGLWRVKRRHPVLLLLFHFTGKINDLTTPMAIGTIGSGDWRIRKTKSNLLCIPLTKLCLFHEGKCVLSHFVGQKESTKLKHLRCKAVGPWLHHQHCPPASLLNTGSGIATECSWMWLPRPNKVYLNGETNSGEEDLSAKNRSEQIKQIRLRLGDQVKLGISWPGSIPLSILACCWDQSTPCHLSPGYLFLFLGLFLTWRSEKESTGYLGLNPAGPGPRAPQIYPHSRISPKFLLICFCFWGHAQWY